MLIDDTLLLLQGEVDIILQGLIEVAVVAHPWFANVTSTVIELRRDPDPVHGPLSCLIRIDISRLSHMRLWRVAQAIEGTSSNIGRCKS
jgi:hypothetical protein